MRTDKQKQELVRRLRRFHRMQHHHFAVCV